MIVTIVDDFDLQKIADSGQCFRCRNFDGIYRFITGGHVIYLKPGTAGSYDVSCTCDEWKNIWIPYFDLERNYQEVRNSVRADGFMEKAAEAGRGIRILRQEPWEMLASFIISQRKSIPAIKKAIESLATLCGKALHTQYEDIHSFPSAEELCNVSDAALADCGLGYRVPYIKDAAARIKDNPAALKEWALLEDSTLLERLKTIHGVGDKVANCVMLFAYGRMASVPVDTWINKVITERYQSRNPFPAYGVHAGIMQQYTFYYMQQHKGGDKAGKLR
ncbi:MAG: DNA-3-methyladenine glycosylase 2 family protein [Lachnospiraceae bacterium]|nr:DNA-3-methyladenine glycosylase 2 family protein [Lachnospiraceae bacterium]